MSLSFAVTRSRFRCVAVLLTIALLTTTISAVPAAHASPDTGLDKSLCNSDASRVTIPDDLPVKACFDGKTLVLENSLPFPIEARTDNGGTPVVSPTTEATLPGAITSLMAPMGDGLTPPGYRLSIPIRESQTTVSLILPPEDQMSGYVWAQQLYNVFGAVELIGIGQALAELITELVTVTKNYRTCLMSSTWFGKIGCLAGYEGNIGFAFGRFGLKVVTPGIIEAIYDVVTTAWDTNAAVTSLNGTWGRGQKQLVIKAAAQSPAAVAMTMDNLRSAQLPDMYLIPAGPMTDGVREGGNGGRVEIVDPPPPVFGDFTGDGVVDAAVYLEGSSGVGGTYGEVALFTDGGKYLGNFTGSDATQARMAGVTSLSVGDGRITVVWGARDNAHPVATTWQAQLRWDGAQVVADNVAMQSAESGGQPVDPQGYRQPDRTGIYWNSPSGNITCSMGNVDNLAKCLIAQIDYSGPSTCPAGPIYAGLDQSTGQVTTACGGDSEQLPGPPKVLEFGQSISEAATECVSTDRGMTCTDNNSGHGFTLSRTGFTQF